MSTTQQKASFTTGFTTLAEETRIANLEVHGAFPDWLQGSLIRNGPAQFEVGARSFNHWFDGAAMLHRFGFAGGKVSYANKYLQTPGYVGNKAAGKISFREFATDPCRNLYQRVMSTFKPSSSHNASVNLTKLAGEFLALTETPLPVAFDAETLETVGVVGFEDKLGFGSTTAHPHFDPQRRVGINHLIGYGRESAYSFITIPDEKPLRRQVVSQLKVAEPAYIHSFGVTENYLILAEYPLTVNPLELLLSGKPFIENFKWHPERGARFLIFSKEDGKLVRSHAAEAFFSFHHINAFEENGDIVVDISGFHDDQLVQQLYLNRLRGEHGGDIAFPEFRRYRLPKSGGAATYEVLSDYAIELPRINYRTNGKPYRYAYGSSIAPEKRGDFLNALVKVDVNSRESKLWFEDGCYPGEPVFVAAPGQGAEDEGVILSVVLDGAKGTSFLLVLDAASFEERARALVPHHIPFGFHGQYFTT